MLNRFLRIILGGVVILLTWLIVFLVINLVPSKLAVEENTEVKTTFKRLAEISKGGNYSSDFMARNNGLNRVDVLFKNPNLESRDELLILVKSGNSIVYQQSFTGFNFGDTSHARLDFGLQNSSSGKKYTVEIVPTKIVDGKLFFGTKNNEISFIQYYVTKFSVKSAFRISLQLVLNIITSQTIVYILPLLLVIILLW